MRAIFSQVSPLIIECVEKTNAPIPTLMGLIQYRSDLQDKSVLMSQRLKNYLVRLLESSRHYTSEQTQQDPRYMAYKRDVERAVADNQKIIEIL